MASTWTEPSIILALLSSLGGLSWFIWKYPLKALRKWVARINDALDKVTTLWRETQPNGGASMRDQLKRLCRDVARTASAQLAQFHSNPSATMEIDRDGSVSVINHSALDLLGMTVEEAINKGWMGALAPGYRANIIDQLKDAGENPQRMTVHVVMRRNQSDGTNATLTFHPLVDDEEKLSGYLVHIDTLESRYPIGTKILPATT